MMILVGHLQLLVFFPKSLLFGSNFTVYMNLNLKILIHFLMTALLYFKNILRLHKTASKKTQHVCMNKYTLCLC